MQYTTEAIERGARALYARLKQPSGEVSEHGATIWARWEDLPRPVQHPYRRHASTVLNAANNTP